MYLAAYIRKRQKVLYGVLMFFIFYISVIYLLFSYGLVDKPLQVKIVLWTSVQNPPSSGQLSRMNKILERMSRENQRKMCLAPENSETSEIASDWEHCEFSMSHEEVHKADAVVFSMFKYGFKLSDLPLEARSPGQLWIMYRREPPTLSEWKDPLRNIFNWTMSYRRDSDVWTPYGLKIQHIRSRILIGNVTLGHWISGKSKLVVGVISRCLSNSKREELIAQMNATGITVDIFGGCGQTVCGRYSKNCSEFWTDLARNYKFYLAFENSLCTDYITEKMWRALQLGMVPVVYGGGNYSVHAPPNSYIDVRNFSSAQSLMKYLKMLDENPEAYAEYFKWRLDYTIKDNGGLSRDWCVLCKAVHRYKMKSRYASSLKKLYGNIQWWWQHDPISNVSLCTEPHQFLQSENGIH